MPEPFLELPLTAAVNLRLSRGPQLDAVDRVLGVRPPEEPNRFSVGNGHTVAWLGPDEWLVLAPGEDGLALERALATELGGGPSVTDVTGNRIAFRLAGEGARDLLSAGCPLDLHPRTFRPGQCAQTVMARTGILLLQRDEAPRFDVLVRRSFGRYLSEWMSCVAALRTPA